MILTLFVRLQNVLEDFRDMDATALEETKATVRSQTVYQNGRRGWVFPGGTLRMFVSH